MIHTVHIYTYDSFEVWEKGIARWVNVRGNPVHLSDCPIMFEGEVICTMSLSTDITLPIIETIFNCDVNTIEYINLYKKYVKTMPCLFKFRKENNDRSFNVVITESKQISTTTRQTFNHKLYNHDDYKERKKSHLEDRYDSYY